MTLPATSGTDVLVAPRRSLLRNGALSFLLVSVALFGSIYVLAVPRGTWPAVVSIHVAVTTAFVAAWVRYLATHVGVQNGRLHYHGFLRPKWSVPAASVRSVTIVHTYRPNAPDTSAQFLARDADGGRVLRMRGLFWHESDMRRVAAALDRELDIVSAPMTTREFLAAYPGSAFWFERRPVVVVAGVTALLAISFGVVLALMALTGIAFGHD